MGKFSQAKRALELNKRRIARAGPTGTPSAKTLERRRRKYARPRL